MKTYKVIRCLLVMTLLLGCDSEQEARERQADQLNEELGQLILAKGKADTDRIFLKNDYADSLHEEAEQIVLVEEIRSNMRRAVTAGEIALLTEDLKTQTGKLEALTKRNDDFAKKLEDLLKRFYDEKERASCDAIYAYRLSLMAAAKSHALYQGTSDWEKRMNEFYRLKSMSSFDAQWFLDEFGRKEAD